jgi:glycosyltransferase involved in cell wall biosynthesis
MNIVYIIPKITHGGGMPNILTEVTTMQKLGIKTDALVISLESGVSTELLKSAIAIGLKTLITPSKNLLKKILVKADLLVVHYWNCPSLYSFYKLLTEERIESRICINLKVNGCTLPQVVPQWIYQTSDAFIYSNPLTPTESLPHTSLKLNIPSLVNLPDFKNPINTSTEKDFKLFHAGTLNVFKLHPRFIELHTNLSKMKYSLSFWGAGADETFLSQIKEFPWINYFGFSSNLSESIQSHHLLCNPQTLLSYGSFDKIMLECQWLGKPVITLKNSYISTHIKHNINGLVADDEYAYKLLLTNLIEDPKEYKKIAESTLSYSHANYSLDKIVMLTYETYESTLKQEKKIIHEECVPENPINAVLDGMGKWKDKIVNIQNNNLDKEELYYALYCEGGLIHYLNQYPTNIELKTIILNLME